MKELQSSLSIKPVILLGRWDIGYALDAHTIESHFVGRSLNTGKKNFETIYTPLGDKLHLLKYQLSQFYLWGRKRKQITELVGHIAEEAARFITSNISVTVDAIVTVPPSNDNRKFQPVYRIASALGKRLGVPVRIGAVYKLRATTQSKDVKKEDKMGWGKDIFDVQKGAFRSLNILIFDDLYQTGTTMNAITALAKEKGQAKSVSILCLTKSRTK